MNLGSLTSRDFQEVPKTRKTLQRLGFSRADFKYLFDPCTPGTWVAKPPEILQAIGRAQRDPNTGARRGYFNDRTRQILTDHEGESVRASSAIGHAWNGGTHSSGTFRGGSPRGAGPAKSSGERRQRKFPHLTLVRGHHATHPNWIAGSISALTAHGLPYFHEDQPAIMVTPTTRRSAKTIRHARQCTESFTVPTCTNIDPLCPELPVAPAVLAASQMFAQLNRDTIRWWVPSVRGWRPEKIRVIQTADAICEHLGLTPAELVEEMRQWRPAVREVEQLIQRHALAGAQSPPETIVRLTLAGMPGLSDMETQFVARDADGKIATADLGSRRARLLVFYDGEYHSDGAQREWDTHVNGRLLAVGYRTLRLSARHLRDPDGIARLVQRVLRH